MRRYPRYKSFNIDLDEIWRRVAVEKARITAEQDAGEQARRSLGVEDDRPLPYDYQSDYTPRNEDER
jgi:hypothetical protein